MIASVMDLLRREDKGQGLVEYGLVITLVSIASMAALKVLGGTISALIMQIVGAF